MPELTPKQIELRAKVLFYGDRGIGRFCPNIVWENDTATHGLKKGESVPIPEVLPDERKAYYREKAKAHG